MPTDTSERIHPTAVIHPGAHLGEGVEVGPYSIIGDHVSIGAGTRVRAHVIVDEYTEIGERCDIHPGSIIGAPPQDKKYQGEVTWARIGNQTTIREYVTVNRGTSNTGETRVGDRTLLMAYVHIAHDCRIGDDVVVANAVTMGGHVVIESQAIVGGLVGIHQFVRIGKLSIIGGCSKAVKDVPPFLMADGNPLKIYGINRAGLERAGIDASSREALKKAHRFLYRSDLSVSLALSQIEREVTRTPEISYLLQFIKASGRGISKST